MDDIDIERLIELMNQDEYAQYERAGTEAAKQQVLQRVINRIGIKGGVQSPAQIPLSSPAADAVTPTPNVQGPPVQGPMATAGLAGDVASIAELQARMSGQKEIRNVKIQASLPQGAPRVEFGIKQPLPTKVVDVDTVIKNLTQSFITGKPENGISYEAVKNQLVQNGVVVPDAKYSSVISMYSTWLNLGSTIYDNGKGVDMTIDEIINSYGNREGKAAAASVGINLGPAVTTTKTFTEYDVESALSIAESAYGKKLGRKPSKKQLQKVVNELNRRAQQAPSVATTTRTGAGSTTVSYGGGISPTTIAEQVAETDPMFAETDFVTNFIPLVERVFRNPISRGS